MDLNNIDLSACVSYGESSLSQLGEELNIGEHRSILLVTGQKSYEHSGVCGLLKPILEGRKVLRVSNFSTNPKRLDVERIIEELRGAEFTAIIAIGGGSVIDMAKLIKCFLNNPAQIEATLYHGSAPSPAEINLWAIPTTAGSGSEATHFAVVYDGEEKFSVGHQKLLPKKSWILPKVLAKVPEKVAAASGLDAFCQGVESYWSIYSTQESQALAEEAIKLSWKHMTAAVLDHDLFAIEQMGKASHLAGRAINITKTTAPHAVSYILTSHFGILHGHAVAILLTEILCYNDKVTDADVLDARGVIHVKKVLRDIVNLVGETSVLTAAAAIRAKITNLGLSVNIREMGVVTEADRELIIKSGFNPERVNNNPRRLSEDRLCEILNKMMQK